MGDEKKALYRASFCQTFPEFLNHRNGEWKLWFGTAIGFLSLALWLWFFCKLYVYKPLPSAFRKRANWLRCAMRSPFAKTLSPVLPADGITRRISGSKRFAPSPTLHLQIVLFHHKQTHNGWKDLIRDRYEDSEKQRDLFLDFSFL